MKSDTCFPPPLPSPGPISGLFQGAPLALESQPPHPRTLVQPLLEQGPPPYPCLLLPKGQGANFIPVYLSHLSD